jgi:hypothetical protein
MPRCLQAPLLCDERDDKLSKRNDAAALDVMRQRCGV